MNLPPLRAAALAAMAFFAIPCGVAQAQPGDTAAANAPLSAEPQTTAGGTESVGASSSEADSSGGANATEEAPPLSAQVPQAPTEPTPAPPAEPPATPPDPSPTASGGDPATAPPGAQSDESPKAAADSRSGEGAAAPELGPNHSSAPNEGGESAVASSTPAEPGPSVTGGAGPMEPPATRPEQIPVDRLLPRLHAAAGLARERGAAGPARERGAAAERPPERGAPSPGVHLSQMNRYIRVQAPASAAPRHVAPGPRERGSEPSRAGGPRGIGFSEEAPAPSSPAPGSASASPGGGFFAGGLASLAALLIALALPQLRSRLELPPRGRCTVAFLRPLERPG